MRGCALLAVRSLLLFVRASRARLFAWHRPPQERPELLEAPDRFARDLCSSHLPPWKRSRFDQGWLRFASRLFRLIGQTLQWCLFPTGRHPNSDSQDITAQNRYSSDPGLARKCGRIWVLTRARWGRRVHLNDDCCADQADCGTFVAAWGQVIKESEPAIAAASSKVRSDVAAASHADELHRQQRGPSCRSRETFQ